MVETYKDGVDYFFVDELQMCFLDYMSDDELDEYEDYLKEQFDEMSKLL